MKNKLGTFAIGQEIVGSVEVLLGMIQKEGDEYSCSRDINKRTKGLEE